jgi:hypothetical protein
MNGYVGFFNGQRVEVYAETSYEAYKKAVEHFKPRKSQTHLVHVHLAEVDGEPYVHRAVD